jgi:hypothetical protein
MEVTLSDAQGMQRQRQVICAYALSCNRPRTRPTPRLQVSPALWPKDSNLMSCAHTQSESEVRMQREVYFKRLQFNRTATEGERKNGRGERI